MNSKTETTRTADQTAPANPPPRFTKRIGNTTYRVRVHFNPNSRETMHDKIIRMIKNEAAGKSAGI